MTYEYGAIFLSMKNSFVQSIKTVEKEISYINSDHRRKGTRRYCNSRILETSQCFDLSVKNNDVEIAELIISIWSLSVKSRDIAQHKDFTR